MNGLNTNRAIIGYPTIEVTIKDNNTLYCSKCPLNPHNTLVLVHGYAANNTAAMLQHITLHEQYGDNIPVNLIEMLLAEDSEIFSDGGTGGGIFISPAHSTNLAYSFGATH